MADRLRLRVAAISRSCLQVRLSDRISLVATGPHISVVWPQMLFKTSTDSCRKSAAGRRNRTSTKSSVIQPLSWTLTVIPRENFFAIAFHINNA
jgi:hypothetical protein